MTEKWKIELLDGLKSLADKFFKWIKKLVKWYEKCVEADSDYVEK